MHVKSVTPRSDRPGALKGRDEPYNDEAPKQYEESILSNLRSFKLVTQSESLDFERTTRWSEEVIREYFISCFRVDAEFRPFDFFGRLAQMKDVLADPFNQPTGEYFRRRSFAKDVPTLDKLYGMCSRLRTQISKDSQRLEFFNVEMKDSILKKIEATMEEVRRKKQA